MVETQPAKVSAEAVRAAKSPAEGPSPAPVSRAIDRAGLARAPATNGR